MRNMRVASIIAGMATMVVIAGILIGLISYADSRTARINLLSQYFHALAAKDTALIDDLTGADFVSDLPAINLGRGAYQLFDFGTSEAEGLKMQRFMLVFPGADGFERALLADMIINRIGVINEISAIRLSETGVRIKK